MRTGITRQIIMTGLIFLLNGTGLLARSAGILAAPSREAATTPEPRFSFDGFQEIRSGRKQLEEGERGKGVAMLQQALEEMGFCVRGSDGIFGPQTLAALEEYQRHAGLPASGRLDQVTLESLEEEAPAAGKKLWEVEDPGRIPSPWVMVKGQRRLARVVVVKNENRAFLFTSDQKLTRIFPIALGTPESPTRSGLRLVVDKLNEEQARSVGISSRWKTPYAFGVRILDLWETDPATGESRDVAQEIHGTFERESIGSQASHGCIRLYNEDVVFLYDAVEPGALVLIAESWNENRASLPGAAERQGEAGKVSAPPHGVAPERKELLSVELVGTGP